MPVGGGKALKKAIHVARAKAGITSDMQLSLRSGVHYDTFLEAAYEGRDPEPQPLQDAVRDLTGAVRALVTEMREDRERGQDAAAAMLRAAEALPRLEANGLPSVTPAPHETAGSGR